MNFFFYQEMVSALLLVHLIILQLMVLLKMQSRHLSRLIRNVMAMLKTGCKSFCLLIGLYHVTTGIAPCELLLKRRLKTRFDLLKPVENYTEDLALLQKILATHMENIKNITKHSIFLFGYF